MRVSLAVVAEKMVEAVLQRAARGVEHAHAPLADARGRVAGAFEQLRDGECPRRQRKLALGLDLAVRAHGEWPMCRPVISDVRLGAQTVVPQYACM